MMAFVFFLLLPGNRNLCGGGWRPALDVVFPGDQQPPQQLSYRRFRDRIDEDKFSRTLEVRQPGIAAECFEIGLADIPAALDERGDDLSPSLVGETDDRDLRHQGMQRQTAFDLHRRYVLAASDDHVVGPAGDEQVAILV